MAISPVSFIYLYIKKNVWHYTTLSNFQAFRIPLDLSFDFLLVSASDYYFVIRTNFTQHLTKQFNWYATGYRFYQNQSN